MMKSFESQAKNGESYKTKEIKQWWQLQAVFDPELINLL